MACSVCNGRLCSLECKHSDGETMLANSSRILPPWCWCRVWTSSIQRVSHSSSTQVFSDHIKQVQRDRALKVDSSVYDYLKDEVAYRIADRVFDVKRRFPVIVDIGTHKGMIGTHLTKETTDCIIHTSSSLNSLKHIPAREDGVTIEKMHTSEQDVRLEEGSIDMAVSSLCMHWVNDLPRMIANVFHCLKQDGVFIGCMFGGQTLFELRSSLQLAEMEREGGFGLHVSPFTTPQDVGGLLNRAGFTMLTIDSDEIVVNYPSMFELMFDLQGMAENNAMLKARTHVSRESLLSACAIYHHLYPSAEPCPQPASPSVSATFQIFYFIGWKPHPSQPSPAPRGSANFSLKDLAHLDKRIKKDGEDNKDG